ncbi:hypothetical protein [Vibrio campbellii]|uniref:hypothetical protein n=1 Tax=Vibrio campbellii TaxID=680 RepID=UPI00210C63FE|nr:hypothetical protein [Vibrio campbellii]UTZ44588.1 hypothetical protein HB764_25350 [Vibrio campbellii]
MPIEGKESEMAENIMDEMEKVGLNPRAGAALSDKLWTAVSKGVIKTFIEHAEVPVTKGDSAGNYKVT